MKPIKLQKFLIAGGNSTLLVWNCPKTYRAKIIDRYLGGVEQVGFIEQKGEYLGLVMMGNELCIDATIALASTLGNSGRLFTSGVKNPVEYKNITGLTIIKLPLTYKKTGNTVLLEGIGCICSNKPATDIKGLLVNLTKKYRLPAFALIRYKKNRIIPYVYVKQTNSLFRETACGSGSIALSLYLRKEVIIQPTGEKIFVQRSNNIFTVGAKVSSI